MLLLAETYRTVSEFLMRVDQGETARGDMEQVLKLLPANAERNDEARATRDMAVAIETARSWKTLGQLHFRAERYTDALAAWQSARTVLEQPGKDARMTLGSRRRWPRWNTSWPKPMAFWAPSMRTGTLRARFYGRAVEGFSGGGPARVDTRRSRQSGSSSPRRQLDANELPGNGRVGHDARGVGGMPAVGLAQFRVELPGTDERDLADLSRGCVGSARAGLGLLAWRCAGHCIDTLDTYEPSYWMAGPYYQALACSMRSMISSKLASCLSGATRSIVTA